MFVLTTLIVSSHLLSFAGGVVAASREATIEIEVIDSPFGTYTFRYTPSEEPGSLPAFEEELYLDHIA